jgi:glycosyltransferase involved in cell wall biosynthesis
MSKIKLLTFTSLYPNSEQPIHGIFVENRLRHLLDSGQVESKVVAPVPWFPFSATCFGSYGKYAKIPKREQRHGIDILHPRYPVIPKIGMTVAPFFMALSLLPVLRTILKKYPFDIIDAHYFFPDGVAAVALGRILSKPVVVTARGSDINLISRYLLPQTMIRWAGQNSSALITVSQALKDALVSLGIESGKVTPLRNGVDLNLFHPPGDRDGLRHRLNLQGRVVLSVGNLVTSKGHEIVIRALANIPGTCLVIAGDGEEGGNLRRLVGQLHLGDRVRFLGVVDHERLCDYYGAADVLALASSREGWANVLLEAMACGTPVVAFNVGGTREVVRRPEAGMLVAPLTSEALGQALSSMLRHPSNRVATRSYAEQHSWKETIRGQIDIFCRLKASSHLFRQ